MRALITQRETLDKHGVKIDVLESTYTLFFENLGIRLHPVSNFSNFQIDEHFDESFDCIILSGGGDLKRSHVLNSVPGEEQPNRDKLEAKLLKFAKERKIPVLAICRGFQFMNNYLGGRVSRIVNSYRQIGVEHNVSFGKGKKIHVNHYHQDGVYAHDLASNVQLIGIDEEEDVVEAFYHTEYRWLAIQWHPEREITDETSSHLQEDMIKSFIEGKGILYEGYYLSSRSRDET